MTINRFFIAALLLLTACSGIEKDSSKFPQERKYERIEERGKVTGDDGFILFGGSSKKSNEGSDGLAVNSYLWRATLDSTSFMPLASTDPFGGVIITDWHENTDAPGERFKLHVVILSRELRADGLKVSVFRQTKDKGGEWRDATVSDSMSHEFENIILNRARELRIQAGG